MSNLRGPGPIPNRWLYCPRKSETFIAERFLAFKTPLSNDYKSQMPIGCIFPPEMIFGYCKTLKMTLGLWIDLTNTSRFYDRAIVESNGAHYIKLQCRGHGETPSREQTQSFIEIVDEFINDRPFDIIAVHCTHGFNRTGFLIVSYLVERLDCSVSAALSMFATARPPGIYKQDYINELFRRYDDEESSVQAPALPDWCLEYDDSNGNDHSNKRKFDEAHSSNSPQAKVARGLYGNEHSNNTEEASEDLEEDSQLEGADGENAVNGGGLKKKKRRREMVLKNATFMAGVPGVTLVTDQPRLSQLQLKVQKMCGWQSNGFPGSQPVSMDPENLKLLSQIPYRVSWKADGTRYMMLINKRDEIYFFDRNFSCFQVENLTFVKSNNLHEHLEDTLIDGEMVIDKVQNQSIPRYLIYDVVIFSNDNIGQKPFYPDRLSCIKNEIIGPRHKAIRNGVINRPLEPFSLRNKDFWEIGIAGALLGEKFAKSLSHEPDGLIFQPSKLPYTAGACPEVLKWKPHHMNSVDFRLKIAKECGKGIVTKKVGLLYVGGYDMPFCQIKYSKAIKDLDNKIVECTINKGQWEFMRERTDKTMPNSYSTAHSVYKSILNPVTRELLLEYIATKGFKEDKIEMPPPQNTNHIPRPPHQQHPQQQQLQRQQLLEHQMQQHHHQQQQHHHQQQLQQQHHHLQQHQQQQQHHQQQQQQQQPHHHQHQEELHHQQEQQHDEEERQQYDNQEEELDKSQQEYHEEELP